MFGYWNKPASLNPRSFSAGGQPVLYLVLWLAICLLEIATFELDAPLKRMLHQSKLKSGTCITQKKFKVRAYTTIYTMMPRHQSQRWGHWLPCSWCAKSQSCLISGNGDAGGLLKLSLYDASICIRYLIRGISMETKGKKTPQSLMIGADYNPSFYVLKKASENISRCQAQSTFRWGEGRQWQSDRFSWFVLWMSLVVFLRGLHSNRHEDCLYMNCCGDFSEVYIKLSHFSFHGFGKGQF